MEHHGNLRSFSLSPADRGLRPLRGSSDCRNIEGPKEFPENLYEYMEFQKNCASSSVSSSRQLRNSSQDWSMGFQSVWLRCLIHQPWMSSQEAVHWQRALPAHCSYKHTHIHNHTCMHCSQERTLASTASARISSQMWPLSFLGLH